MTHPRNRTIQTTDKFILRKRTRKTSGRVYYELAYCRPDIQGYAAIEDMAKLLTRIRDIIDPTRNRSGRWGTAWTYSNRAAAERDLLLLTMML